jgi:beta-galactosidase
MKGPVVTWCGMEVTRPWRRGCRGNVASVLIEKPACGDFLPIIDGGFSLQYSPLLEYRQERGMILFCQMDVTGRTEEDPAARLLVENILEYAREWRPPARRKAAYIGEAAGREHLERAGIYLASHSGLEDAAGRTMILGPGGASEFAGGGMKIQEWLAAGGKILAVGLDENEAGTLGPVGIQTRKMEYISAHFEPFDPSSVLAGIGPADVHNRAPAEVAMVAKGADEAAGPAQSAANGNLVVCQLVPWRLDFEANYGLRRTFRRSSCLLARLLCNLGAESATPLIERFREPLDPGKSEERWREGLYLDVPQEWDDPYRFFRW